MRIASEDSLTSVHGKKGTEKRAQVKNQEKGHKRKKNYFICKLLLLLFNQHLNYSMCIFCGCLLFNVLEKWL